MKKIFIILISIIILTLVFLFAIEHSPTEELPANGEIMQEEPEKEEPTIVVEDQHFTMSVIGDIMCHNSQYKDAYVSSNDTYDFSYVFEDIRNYISEADISVGNLETTFAGKAKGYSNYPRFNTPEQLAYDLKDLGIDVLSTANNHSMDTNFEGVISTLNYLDDAGISHTGTNATAEAQNEILVKEVNGVKIAFLAFTYGTNGIPIPSSKPFAVNLIDDNFILQQLSLAKEEEPDLICVNMHWGYEFHTKQSTEQERLADLLFKNGVDVIFGSHPHVLQPMEKKTVTLEDGTTKDCFVIYSLGNFMSGQTKANAKNSIILNISFTKSGETGKTNIDSVSYVPIYMYKSPSGNTKRYKVLDIEKTIENYDNGTNTSIGSATYSTLQAELSKIKNIMGENIQF
ncbi:MAG: CapA family protein [Clostridia bacterium]|nr:CapA family protein [Clostridia bacterium]